MFAAVVSVVLALAPAVPPPGPVTIEVLSLKGDGCPAGTTAVAMSLDNEAFTVTYSDFIVQARGAEARKTCEISLRVNHPEGFTYGIAQTDYRGFAQIGAGARGVARAHYFFPGLPTRHSSTTYPGPMSDNWQVTDVLPPADVVHGPCRERKPLTINAELRVNGKSSTSVMTMDSTDSSVSSTFRLSWRKCP